MIGVRFKFSYYNHKSVDEPTVEIEGSWSPFGYDESLLDTQETC